VEVASATRVRPRDESIIGRLRTICIERDRLEPISIDDLAEGASSVSLGWRALLVVGIEGWPPQPVRLVWYATRPASLSPYADVAGAFAQIASLALGAVAERDQLSRAVAARHRVGLAQGILMPRRQLAADKAFTLLRRHSQNTNVKLRTVAQTVIQTGDLVTAAGDISFTF
jgi:hypothetical protein